MGDKDYEEYRECEECKDYNECEDYEMNNYPHGLRLAQAYVPFQAYDEHYPPLKGLKKGTIFPELYRPYKSDY
jgi:hypothetical protein